MTINAADPNFGYVAGLTYSFRRGNGALSCTGEIGANAAAYTTAEAARGNSNAGYWSTLGNSNNVIKQQIINDLQGSAVTIGDALPVVSGNRQAEFANGGNPGARARKSFAGYQSTAPPTPNTAPAEPATDVAW